MQASYHITQAGLLYAIASVQAEEERCFLLAFLKKNNTSPFSFSDAQAYYEQDTEIAFKQICSLLEQGFIDISDNVAHLPVTQENRPLNSEYLLSDLNGLPIRYQGFERTQADQLAAIANDYIRVSRRSLKNYETGKLLSPVSLDIRFHDKDVCILLLHLGNFSCLLTVTDPTSQQQNWLFPFIRSLCNRYDHDRA